MVLTRQFRNRKLIFKCSPQEESLYRALQVVLKCESLSEVIRESLRLTLKDHPEVRPITGYDVDPERPMPLYDPKRRKPLLKKPVKKVAKRGKKVT